MWHSSGSLQSSKPLLQYNTVSSLLCIRPCRLCAFVLLPLSQALATVAALQPSDRASLERLGGNWSEQLLLEEGFLNAVYHHLQYTLHMIWEHVQKLMEDVADDVEDLQHKYRVSEPASVPVTRCRFPLSLTVVTRATKSAQRLWLGRPLVALVNFVDSSSPVNLRVFCACTRAYNRA